MKAKEVADWFIAKSAESGDLITHLKVQKLVYFAEAWSQTLDDKPLIDEEFQAWAHGPVVPEVFQAFKEHGWQPLPVPENQQVPEVPDQYLSVLNQVFDSYGGISAKTLENMTHRDSPWIDARGDCSPEERCDKVIDKSAIKKFYKKKYKKEEYNNI